MTELVQTIRVKDPSLLNRYFRRMSIVLLGTSITLYFLQEVVISVFKANMPLNSIIVCVFFVGVFICFRNLYRLKCDLQALSDLDKLLFETQDVQALYNYKKKMFIMNDLYLSLKNSVEANGEIPKIPTAVARSLVNVANSRFDERKARISYFVNLLIYLGLLGTFIGLSATVGSISGLISDLASGLSGEEDITKTLVVLIKHLESPLAGMGTAFGTSLTGLSCSVILGALSMNGNKASMLFSNIFSNWLYEYAMTSSRAIFAKKHQDEVKQLNKKIERREHERREYERRTDENENQGHTPKIHTINQGSPTPSFIANLSKVENSLITLEKGQTNQLSVLEKIERNSLIQTKTLQSIQEAIEGGCQKANEDALKAHSATKDIVNGINSIKDLIIPHIESLQVQNKHLVKLTAGIVTELKEQADIFKEHASHQVTYYEKASDQRDKIMKEQKNTDSSINQSNQALTNISNNIQHLPKLSSELLPKLPDKINASTRKMLKDTADSLETTFDHQLKSGFEAHQQSMETTIKAEQEAIEDIIKTEQKANKTLILRLFRTLHKLFRMMLRKDI